ncbi:MAG: shikimate dehydrogenase [Magnetococcales bacterium]|nr:shikimate dehydrogenase [Magnetococcales bacterium]
MTAIDGHTRLLAVLGDPVHHSLSPAMHNLGMEHWGLNCRYLAFHVSPAGLPQAVRGLAALGAVGFNATIPHKEALVGLMDELDPTAAGVGAVNTVVIAADGRLTGHNTDTHGFLAAMTAAFGKGPRGLRVLVLGAGGGARGVVEGLIGAGAHEILVANRTPARAEALVGAAKQRPGDATLEAVPLDHALPRLGEIELVVNTTSLGLTPEAPEWTLLHRLVEKLAPGCGVMDIAYAPGETPLVTAARSRGLPATDGLGMLVHQGATAFRLWTGKELPIEAVTHHLRKKLKEREGTKKNRG